MKIILIFFTILLYSFPLKKGDFATGNIFDNSQTKWLKKFKIIDVGGIDDKNIDKKMVIKYNNIVLGYDWLPAFYFYKDGSNNSFVKKLYSHKNKTTLNPNGPFPHCKNMGYNWCDDYYYNFGDKNVIDNKIDFLIKNLKQKKFNGLFFDWAGGDFILQKEYKSIYNNFKKLNPTKNYFKMISLFYKKLKQKNIFFITNQAFRHHKYLLPFIKYDMTESYGTTDKYIKNRIQILNKGFVDKVPITDYYPIDGSLKGSLFYLNLLTKYKKLYKNKGFQNFIYLNYLAPDYKQIYPNQPLYKEIKPKNGIYFAFALAKLTDNIVYSEVDENRNLERDEIYFYKLGKVTGKNYQKIAKNIYVRFYQNGFVLVSDAFSKSKTIKIETNKPFYDVYNKKWIKNGTIILNYQQDIFTKKFLPLGRLFIY